MKSFLVVKHLRLMECCQQNGRVGSSKLSSLHENIKKQAATIRADIVGTLENNQRLTTTKKMMNQEKGNFKIVGKFCGIFTLSLPLPQYSDSLEEGNPHSQNGIPIRGSGGAAGYTGQDTCLEAK